MVVFRGNAGVRAGWRAAAFFVLAGVLVTAYGYWVEPALGSLLHVDLNALGSGALLLDEIGFFASALLATAIMGAFERRRVDSYGLPLRLAFGARFWEGLAIGIVMAGLCGIAMYAAGGFVINGWGLHGSGWIVQPLLWTIGMLLVGLGEEMGLRGYLLVSLARGMGFWPAAALSSLIFGALHVMKPDENFIDIFNVIALGFVMCITYLRTGSLWLAVGFHQAFDLMQFFVIGTRNGGAVPQGTLFDAAFPGPAWINGGPLGTEASYFMLPLIAAMLFYVLWRHPKDHALDT